MSVTNPRGCKIFLPRTGADEFWQQVHHHYAFDEQLKWKYLAMLALRENAGWPLDKIGMVFGHPKGHISRCLEKVKREIRQHFDVRWDDDEGFSDPRGEDERHFSSDDPPRPPDAPPFPPAA